MADVSIAGLHWFILIPRLNHTRSHRPSDSRSKPYLHRKIIRFGTRITNLLQSYELRGKQSFVSHFSRLLRHAIDKGWGPILYTKELWDPMVRAWSSEKWWVNAGNQHFLLSEQKFQPFPKLSNFQLHLVLVWKCFKTGVLTFHCMVKSSRRKKFIHVCILLYGGVQQWLTWTTKSWHIHISYMYQPCFRKTGVGLILMHLLSKEYNTCL